MGKETDEGGTGRSPLGGAWGAFGTRATWECWLTEGEEPKSRATSDMERGT